MASPNEKLRGRRLALPSAADAARPMSRAELAERVNLHLWRTNDREPCLDADAVARHERGVVRWPNAQYREALRTVLGVGTDAELGFYPTPRGRVGPDNGADDLIAFLRRASAVRTADVVALARITEQIRTGDPNQPTEATRTTLQGHLETLSSLHTYSIRPGTRRRWRPPTATLRHWRAGYPSTAGTCAGPGDGTKRRRKPAASVPPLMILRMPPRSRPTYLSTSTRPGTLWILPTMRFRSQRIARQRRSVRGCTASQVRSVPSSGCGPRAWRTSTERRHYWMGTIRARRMWSSMHTVSPGGGVLHWPAWGTKMPLSSFSMRWPV